MKRKSILLLIPFAAMALAGCGEDPTPPSPSDPCESAEVQLNKTSISLVEGGSEKLTASMSVEGCAVGSVTWSVKNASPAGCVTVDEDGTVHAVAAGTAVVVANGAECNVTVTAAGPVLVTNINVKGTLYPTMEVGDTLKVEYTVEPENAANKEVAFASENEDLATVTSDGVITAVAKGTAKVTVTSVGNPSVSKTLTITINNKAAATPTVTSDGMELVTESNLQDGDKIVINSVVEDKYFTMPEYISGNFIAPVESSIDAEGKLVLNGRSALLTVEVSDSALMFKDSQGRYLHAKSGGNYLDFVAEADDACKFQLNVTEGAANLVCTKDGLSNNTLAYNSKDTRFSFYKPGTAATYPKVNFYKRSGSQPIVATGVEFDAASYTVGIGLNVEVSAHLVPLGAEETEITYSLVDVEPAGSITLEGNKLHGVAAGTAKVVASINEGAITSQVDVTCEEIPPIIEAGTYKLHHTRGGVTYYMAKGPTETSYPIPVTNEDDAQNLEFVSVVGKKDTFLIKTAEDEPVYLCVKDFTKNQLFFGTSEEADEWVVAEGTKEAGQYDIYTEEGATKRFISMYEKDNVVTDFRTYNSATGTNRKENSDLTAVVQKHITGIAITNPPSKLEYKQGEEINLAGLVVTASYSDADPEVVEGYEVSPRVFNEAGTITVTVTYKGKEATFDVTVSERKLASIAVDGDMTKKEYETGDAYDPAGLSVIGTYDNGDHEEVSSELFDWSYDPAELTEGQSQVVVTATMKEGEIAAASKTITGLTVTKKVIPVSRVYIESSMYPNVEVGDTHQIVAHVEPTDADEQGLTYAVKSGSEELLEVTEDGLVTALKKGTGYVVVTAVGDTTKTAEVKFTISNKILGVPDQTDQGFEKISSDADLIDGKLVQFYSSDDVSVYGMGQNPTTSKNQPPKACTLNEDLIVTAEGVATYKLVKNDDASYSFKTAEGNYLAATGTSSGNNLQVVESLTDNAKFSIAFNGTYATIVCTKSGVAGNTMALNPNNGSPIFSCYKPATASGYGKISMFTKDVEVTEVNLSSTAASIVAGSTLTIDAEVLPADVEDKSLVWTSSDEDVATVENGVVSAIGAGEVTIKATATNGVYGEYQLTVTSGAVAVTGVTLDKNSFELYPTESETLVATVAPADATDQTVTWSSDKPEVATVEDGKVVAVAQGTAVITVTTNDGAKTDTCTVTVKALEDGCHLANIIANSLQPGKMSTEEVEISGRIMFKPGNNLIIQDGDHAVIVYKNGASTGAMELGKKVSMKCKVQNYNGAAETEQIANAAVTVSDEVVSYNKVSVTSSALLESTPQSVIADYDNLILKAKPGFVSGSDKSVKIAFEDAPDKEYTLFMKKSLYSETVATVLNSMEIGGKFSITNSYGSVYNGAAQICCGTESVVVDKTVYNPESVEITTLAGEPVQTLNMGAGDSVQLAANVLPVKAAQDISWSVDKADVVSVSQDGVITVTATEDGTAVVTATATGTTVSASVTVNVSLVHEITSIEISGDMKTEYDTKDTDYDVSGLTVTAIYNSDPTDTEDVTDDVDWSFDPAFPAGVVTASQDVEVTATLKGTALTDSINETISVVKAKEYMTMGINMQGFAGVTASGYQKNMEQTEGVLGIKFGSYGYIGSTGQVRGSKTVIADTSCSDDNKNWHFYNIDELTKDVKTITVSTTATGTNKFKGSLYLVYGDTTQKDITSTESNAIAGVLNADANMFTFDVSEVSFKYFKICSGVAFTSGSVSGVTVSLEIEKPEGGIKVDSVELNKKTLTLAPNATETLEATVGPSYADNKELEWSSDNPDVAVIDQTGKVTAVADGKATITATAKDGSGVSDSCVVTVQSGAVVINPIKLSTEGGTSASGATVKIPNGDGTTTDVTDAIKCGTGSVFGAMKIKIPKGATKLVFYAAGWKGEAVTLSISGLSEGKTIALTADTGITSSSPFTLSTSDMENFYKEIDLGTALEEETTITLTATGGKRFVVWSAGYVK